MSQRPTEKDLDKKVRWLRELAGGPILSGSYDGVDDLGVRIGGERVALTVLRSLVHRGRLQVRRAGRNPVWAIVELQERPDSERG